MEVIQPNRRVIWSNGGVQQLEPSTSKNLLKNQHQFLLILKEKREVGLLLVTRNPHHAGADLKTYAYLDLVLVLEIQHF